MKNFLISFTVFLVWSIFGLWLYSWMQNEKKSSGSKIHIAKSEVIDDLNEILIDSSNIERNQIQDKTTITDTGTFKTSDNGLKAINMQGDFVFLYSEGISTELNSSEIHIPISSVDFKYKISTYLIEHPDQELHIHSIYSPVENIVFPNLGIQRGEKMKELLKEVGVPNNRIVIKPVIKSINAKENEWINNIIYFSFGPFNEDRVKDLISIPEGKTIYPKYSGSGIMVNDELKTLLLEIKNYLNNNPELKIEIIGHTDNVGNSVDNYRMGLKYARQVRWYLISKGGFRSDQIIATSRGEEEPIDTNKNNMGRLSNRRIEVIYF